MAASDPIIVGVDGSTNAAAALQWATSDACRRNRDVVALLAWSYIDQATSEDGAPFDPGYEESDARAALDQFVRAAISADAAEHVELRVVCDLPARALLDAAEGASLVVVGARGSGGFPNLTIGSTSTRVVERCTTPVAVVREPLRTAPRIVVGVDGSSTGAEALSWAVAEARARSWPLQVVHVWQRPVLSERIFEDDAPIFAKLDRAARQTIDDALAGVDTTSISLERTVFEGNPAGRLLEAASDGALLVIGSRGIGAFLGTLLGSVPRQIVAHGVGPIVVIPER